MDDRNDSGDGHGSDGDDGNASSHHNAASLTSGIQPRHQTTQSLNESPCFDGVHGDADSKCQAAGNLGVDERSSPLYADPASVLTSAFNDGAQSLSYPPYGSYSPSSPHNKHSDSMDDIYFSYPHMPQPLPPHHHLTGVSLGSGASFPLHRRRGSDDSTLSESDGTLNLERVMSEFGGAPGTLPEFMGTGGNTGIFCAPIRAAMYPCRPPALELRPHPLRETQAGSFLRTIICTSRQLWSGQESGLRYWNLSEVFDNWDRRPAKRGDDDSAPFYESDFTSPVLCLVADEASGFVWSGHKDGKIRSWRVPKQEFDSSSKVEGEGIAVKTIAAGTDEPGSLFREGLSWQAHRTPVLSMVITSYGDIWTGSEGGVLKAWPWECIEKSLSLTIEERHMATLLVERSYMDLRSQVTLNGVCPLPAVDIKFLLSDNSRSKVWSAGSTTFALWDARKKELLKVFNMDGQVENRIDIAQPQEINRLGSMSFIQRSRNVLMGAADAVRRVAQKGTFAEDNQRTEAIVMTI